MAEVGEQAPEFTLRGARGDALHLSEKLRSAAVVLFFYPRDRTSG